MAREAKIASSNKTKGTALESKMDKQMARDRLEQQKRQEEQKAHNIKMMIQSQKEEARNQRELNQVARQNRTR